MLIHIVVKHPLIQCFFLLMLLSATRLVSAQLPIPGFNTTDANNSESSRFEKQAFLAIDQIEEGVEYEEKSEDLNYPMRVKLTPDSRGMLVLTEQGRLFSRVVSGNYWETSEIDLEGGDRKTKWDMALSASGRDLYVCGSKSTSIYHIREEANAWIKNGDIKVDDVSGLRAITLSPEGGFLFACASSPSGLLIFQRESRDGKLTPTQRFWARDDQEPVPELAGCYDLAVSPDSQWLAVSGKQADAVVLFKRGQNSTWQRVWSSKDLPETSQLYINGPKGLAFGSDSRLLYVAMNVPENQQGSDAVVTLRKDSTDDWQLWDIVASRRPEGSTDPDVRLVSSIVAPERIWLDNNTLLVSTYTGLAAFSLDAAGKLQFMGMLDVLNSSGNEPSPVSDIDWYRTGNLAVNKSGNNTSNLLSSFTVASAPLHRVVSYSRFALNDNSETPTREQSPEPGTQPGRPGGSLLAYILPPVLVVTTIVFVAIAVVASLKYKNSPLRR
ncbi:MAG: beta-propeller fold lactonase family protein [Endozoicomonas sp.]